MKRVTAYITGNVQREGYRGRVVNVAEAFGLKGNVQNLKDGRVKIIAEGDEADLERFVRAIDIKNTVIHVSSIDSKYSPATGEFEGFFKEVSSGETDSRLDKGIESMGKMLVAIEKVNDTLNNVNNTLIDMNSNLGGKMDKMLDKQDQMLDKQDQMLQKQDVMIQKQDQMILKQDRTLEKQDELLVEVKDMNRSMNEKADQLIKKQDDLAIIKADIAEIKTALKAKGIM